MMLSYWFKNRKTKWNLKSLKHRFKSNKHSLIENPKSTKLIKFINQEMTWSRKRRVFIKKWTITKRIMLKNYELFTLMKSTKMKSFQFKERSKELMNESNFLIRNANKLENKLQTISTKINFYKSKRRN